MNSKTIISLDVARGLAAILVFMSHVRGYLLMDFSKLPNASKGIITKVFYLMTSLGHESVMIFFVLSGFLVAGSVYRNFEQQNFSWKIYLTNRLTRIYIVYLPALFLTLFWDKIGIFLTHSEYYNGAFGSVLPVGPKGPVDHSIATFLQSLIFLQTITTPVLGTNGVVWSLVNEFWYYLAFPVLMFILIGLRKRKAVMVAVHAILILCFFVFFPVKIVLGFGIWMLGFVAYIISNNVKLILILNSIQWRLISALIFIGCIVFSAYDTSTSWSKDYVVGIGYTLLLLSFLNLQINKAFLRTPIEFLSNISYTLYLVHVPLLAFTICYFFNNKRFDLTPQSLLIFIAYIIGIALYASIIYMLLEKRTPQLRNWILNRIK